MNNPHGEVLERILRQNNVNITKLAQDIGVSKTTIYNWFEAQYLSAEKWDKIGKAIDYDFSNDIPTISKRYRGNPLELKGKVSEEYAFYEPDRAINVTVPINGDDRILEQTIKKLTKINEALKAV